MLSFFLLQHPTLSASAILEEERDLFTYQTLPAMERRIDCLTVGPVPLDNTSAIMEKMLASSVKVRNSVCHYCTGNNAQMSAVCLAIVCILITYCSSSSFKHTLLQNNGVP